METAWKARELLAQGIALGIRIWLWSPWKGKSLTFSFMLLPLQGVGCELHLPRALPWAGSLQAFQAVNISFRNLNMSDYNELQLYRQLHRTMVGAEDIVMDAGAT